MHPAYKLADEAEVVTPALVFHPALIRANIAAVVKAAGGPDRLRPHVKTHKSADVVRLQLDAGVTKHKCATIAEAEMLASAGVPDVLLAYPLIGPNVKRFAELIRTFPGTKFSALVDHPDTLAPIAAIGSTAAPVEVLVDVNLGMDRTGIVLEQAAGLYVKAAATPGLRVGGLHCYDGHHNQESRADREAAVWAVLTRVLEVRAGLERDGLPVPQLVCGGTPAFLAASILALCCFEIYSS